MGARPEEAAEPAPPAGAAEAARCAELLAELERAIELLGRRPERSAALQDEPELRPPPLRELFLRARELERKADRLARDRRMASREDAPLPSAEPTPGDLIASLERALERVTALLPGAPRPSERGAGGDGPIGVDASGDGDASESDGTTDGSNTSEAGGAPYRSERARLLRAMLAAGAALDALCERPPTAGDVHFAATRALAFASSLRALAPGRRMPSAAPLEPVCTNDDVHRALAECWERVERLAEAAGLPRLALAPAPERLQVRTAELLELASILADELGVVHALRGDPALLPPAAHAGGRRTAELLQRVGLLKRQLDELERLGIPGARPRSEQGSAP